MATYRAVQPYQFRGEVIAAGTEITTETEADEREAQLGVRFGKLVLDSRRAGQAGRLGEGSRGRSEIAPPQAHTGLHRARRQAAGNPVAPMTSQDGPAAGSRAIPRR